MFSVFNLKVCIFLLVNLNACSNILNVFFWLCFFGAVRVLMTLQGSECHFNHSCERPKKPNLCHFYRSGHCSRSTDCVYYHETWPCVQFHRDGSCNDGEQCRYSHQELTDETRPLLEKV